MIRKKPRIVVSPKVKKATFKKDVSETAQLPQELNFPSWVRRCGF